MLKLALTVFASLYFQTVWPNWLNIFLFLKKKFVLWPKKTSPHLTAVFWDYVSLGRWRYCKRHNVCGPPGPGCNAAPFLFGDPLIYCVCCDISAKNQLLALHSQEAETARSQLQSLFLPILVGQREEALGQSDVRAAAKSAAGSADAHLAAATTASCRDIAEQVNDSLLDLLVAFSCDDLLVIFSCEMSVSWTKYALMISLNFLSVLCGTVEAC